MARPLSFGKLGVSVVASLGEPPAAPDPDTPFRIAVLGDFSGRANRGVFEPGAGVARRRLLAVDRDNFDEVLARLGVEVRLPLAGRGGPIAPIQFAELEDFHPDRIFERVEAFEQLRKLREQLYDPETFESAVAEVRSWAAEGPAAGSAEKRISPPATRESAPATDGLLDEMLEETQRQFPDGGSLGESAQWSAFLERIVGPHVVPKPDPRQGELVAAVDAAIAGLMCSIMHHADFQAVEAAWRSLHFLLARLETDGQLKVYLCDVSKAELAADLGAADDLRTTGMYKLLVERTVHTPGAEPWAVLLGNYVVDGTREDAELLGRMAKIAREAAAPFLAAASPRLLGCESLAATPDPDDWRPDLSSEDHEAWQSLRKLPECCHLGLALPRFLLRLPYGASTSPVEQFDFEEMPGEPDHEAYLWGNPAFACACLLAQAFSREAWSFRPGDVRDLSGLPVHVYQEDGESAAKPCAEAVLTDRAIETIMEAGFMPFMSFSNCDAIRLARFQSLADPVTGLRGRWS